MRPAINKLLRFMEQLECQHYFKLACQSFYHEFCATHRLKAFSDIEKTVGEASFSQVYPCCLEFFFSNDYRKDGERWNIIDLFLKSRGALLDIKDKQYLRSLRQSHMSIYEIVDVEPERLIVLRDVIESGKPMRVYEKSMTRYVAQWDMIGARVCSEGDRLVMGGGCLPLERETATALAETIRTLQEACLELERNKGADDASGYTPEESERLMKVMWAKEIALGYLEDRFTKINRKIVLQNSDGHKLQFHTLTFSLKTDWKQIAKILKKVPDYHMDEDSPRRKFWNWIQISDEISAQDHHTRHMGNVEAQTIETTLEGEDFDAPVRVLGTIELLEDKLVAQANSHERAKVLEDRLKNLLDAQIGKAAWKKEKTPTLDRKGNQHLSSESEDDIEETGISAEDQTEMLHAMLTKHYREWLDTPLPALNRKTPRQLRLTRADQAKLVDLLKGVENSVRHLERKSGLTSSLDLRWMWEELGLDRDAA